MTQAETADARGEATTVEGRVPWAMQLANRYDKTDPAGHIETCEAAARAVVGLLAATRAWWK